MLKILDDDVESFGPVAAIGIRKRDIEAEEERNKIYSSHLNPSVGQLEGYTAGYKYRSHIKFPWQADLLLASRWTWC